MATDMNKPISPTVRKAPPLPKARTDAPYEATKDDAATNAPANNAPAANNGAPANNAPANNAPVANNAKPANNGDVEATVAPPKTESKNQVMGFFEGFVKEAVDTATGLYTLVTTNPITTAKGVVYMATHPRLAAQAITEPYTTAWKDGRYGEVAGRAGFQVLTLVLTSGALSKAGKGAEVGTKAAVPTATATQAADKVVADMATSMGRRTAERTIEKQIADGTIKFASSQAKSAAIRKLATQETAKYAERLAARNIGQKVAQGIATSGVTDEAITKVMGSAAGKVSADNVYRFAAQGLKAGMTTDQIAARLGEFGAMSSRKAATEFPVALKLMQAEAKTAAVVAAGVTPKAAEALANQLKHFDNLIAGTSDEGLKAGYMAQKQALEKSIAASPRTANLVKDILAGKQIGPAERRMAEIGANVDAAGRTISQAGKGVSDGGSAVRKFLDGPKTIGDYGRAIGAVPRAIGGAVDSAYTGTVNLLKKGIAHLPHFEFKGFDWNKVANIRVPSPWEVITAPVTVPFGAAKYALTHPGRALGIASLAGTVSNVGHLGADLKNRPVDDPNENLNPGYREYELQEGDTLESIAEKELGDKNRWEEIYNLNKEMFDALGNDGTIAAGTKIKLPVDGADKPSGKGAAEAYKDGLLKVIDEKIGGAEDADTKKVLGDLRQRVADMDAEDVYKLKDQLEAQGLVVPEAPSNNAPSNNAPSNNAPANNKPSNNTPGTNAPANNKPGNNAPANNAPANNTPAAPSYTEYTVKRGDTLQGIAQTQLGTWQRWRELVDLNKDKYPSLSSNPDFIAVDWKLKVPAKGVQTAPQPKPAVDPKPPVNNTPAANKAPAANNETPAEPSKAQRDQITKQFNLEGSDGNWKNFWAEISQYPNSTVGPDTGSDADRKGLQGLLNKLGYQVETSGSYFGADGKPNSTAEAVVDFKRRAGLTQGYNVVGADGKPAPDVNEYVDDRTKETMQITLRLLQNPGLRGKAAMDAAVKEAARLQASSIGPEVGSKEARALVQQYLNGLGYKVPSNGEFDKATTDALLDFKRKRGLSTLKDDQGRPVFTPYVDGNTAEALYDGVYQAGDKKK
jgi:nucleoid-associated protein YgaU